MLFWRETHKTFVNCQLRQLRLTTEKRNMKKIYVLILVALLYLQATSAGHAHERCKGKTTCSTGRCNMVVGVKGNLCLAPKHTQSLGEICFTDNECASKRCFRKFKCSGGSKPQYKDLCGSSTYGRCLREKRTGELGESCYVDKDCESNACSGDVAGKLKQNRGVDEETGELNEGHCTPKVKQGLEARSYWVVKFLRKKGDEDYAQTMNLLKTEVVSGPDYEGKVLSYYNIVADHNRHYPFKSRFSGKLKHVRLVMPLRSPPKDKSVIIKTKLGLVYTNEHLPEVRSLTAFNEFLKKKKLEPVTRLEFIGPARRSAGHFLAVAIFVGFRGDKPVYYLGEAGNAAGVAYTGFFAEIGKYTRKAKAYTPTIFTKKQDDYDVMFDMKGNEPKVTKVISYPWNRETKQFEKDPYITVSVAYYPHEQKEDESAVKPLRELWEAFFRMSYIQKGLLLFSNLFFLFPLLVSFLACLSFPGGPGPVRCLTFHTMPLPLHSQSLTPTNSPFPIVMRTYSTAFRKLDIVGRFGAWKADQKGIEWSTKAALTKDKDVLAARREYFSKRYGFLADRTEEPPTAKLGLPKLYNYIWGSSRTSEDENELKELEEHLKGLEEEN